MLDDALLLDWYELDVSTIMMTFCCGFVLYMEKNICIIFYVFAKEYIHELWSTCHYFKFWLLSCNKNICSLISWMRLLKTLIFSLVLSVKLQNLAHMLHESSDEEKVKRTYPVSLVTVFNCFPHVKLLFLLYARNPWIFLLALIQAMFRLWVCYFLV